LQEQVTKAQANATDETVRRQLDVLGPKLKTSSGQFVASYPASMAAAQGKLQDADRGGKEAQEEMVRLRQQAAAAEEAQKAAAAPKPVEALDPNLGRTLRLELLERFGSGPLPAGKAASGGPRDLEFMELLRKGGHIK